MALQARYPLRIGRIAFAGEPGLDDLLPDNALHAAVRHDDDWLSVDVTLPGQSRRWPSAAEAWRLLACNAVLPTGLRFAVNARRQILLRADTLIANAAADPQATAGELIRQMETVLQAPPDSGRASDPPGAKVVAPGDPGEADTPDTLPAMQAAFADAGWPLVVRPSGALEVELADRFAARFARVTQTEKSVHAAFDIVDGKPRWGAPSCRRATGVLLLRANATLRMARACARTARAPLLPRFETGIPVNTTVAVDRALSALSTAAELITREFAILMADPLIAKRYLSMRGARADSADSSSTTEPEPCTH